MEFFGTSTDILLDFLNSLLLTEYVVPVVLVVLDVVFVLLLLFKLFVVFVVLVVLRAKVFWLVLT